MNKKSAVKNRIKQLLEKRASPPSLLTRPTPQTPTPQPPAPPSIEDMTWDDINAISDPTIRAQVLEEKHRQGRNRINQGNPSSPGLRSSIGEATNNSVNNIYRPVANTAEGLASSGAGILGAAVAAPGNAARGIAASAYQGTEYAAANFRARQQARELANNMPSDAERDRNRLLANLGDYYTNQAEQARIREMMGTPEFAAGMEQRNAFLNNARNSLSSVLDSQREQAQPQRVFMNQLKNTTESLKNQAINSWQTMRDRAGQIKSDNEMISRQMADEGVRDRIEGVQQQNQLVRQGMEALPGLQRKAVQGVKDLVTGNTPQTTPAGGGIMDWISQNRMPLGLGLGGGALGLYLLNRLRRRRRKEASVQLPKPPKGMKKYSSEYISELKKEVRRQQVTEFLKQSKPLRPTKGGLRSLIQTPNQRNLAAVEQSVPASTPSTSIRPRIKMLARDGSRAFRKWFGIPDAPTSHNPALAASSQQNLSDYGNHMGGSSRYFDPRY